MYLATNNVNQSCVNTQDVLTAGGDRLSVLVITDLHPDQPSMMLDSTKHMLPLRMDERTAAGQGVVSSDNLHYLSPPGVPVWTHTHTLVRNARMRT